MTDEVRFANPQMRFTAPNIEAIRAGRKTQTRRPVKPQPVQCSQPLMHDFISCGQCKYAIRQRVNVVTADDVDTGITIEITGICIQRLHDIDDVDSIAEGASDHAAFRDLWATIYGPERPFAWERNPFVWVYQFTVVN